MRVLVCKKANYSRTGLEIRLRWERGVFKLVAQADSGATRAADAKADAAFLDMLRAYTAQGRSVSESMSNRFAPAMFAADPGAAGFTKRAFQGAMNRLFADGRIGQRNSGRPRSAVSIW